VSQRGLLVDPPADGLDDEADHFEQLVLILESGVRQQDLAAHLGVYLARAQDHDLGHLVCIRPRILERLEDMRLRLPEELARLFPGSA